MYHRMILHCLIVPLSMIFAVAAAAQDRPAVHAGDDGGRDHRHHGNSEMLSTAVKFTPNRGQIVDTRGELRPEILYAASLGRVALYLGRNRFSYVFSSEPTERAREFARHDWIPDPERRHPTDLPDGTPHPDSMAILKHRVDMELVGANPDVAVESEIPASGVSNYYLGHCPAGIVGVPSFQRLVYREIYPHIDLIIAATERGAKFDFVVRGGGRPEDIRIRYVGADDIAIADDGSLRVANPLGYLGESAPYSYQGAASAFREIPSRFTMRNGVLGFAVDAYDPEQTIVVDPEQEWATFWGGAGSDQVIGGDPTEVDRQGNCFIAGFTTSTDAYLATPGAFRATNGGGTDALVVKFDAFGNVVFSTYYGGSGGGVGDIAHGVTADANGNIFITGHTDAGNLPMINAFQGTYNGNRDAFAAKFTASGVCLWSTYCGGVNFDDGYASAVDSSGNVVLTMTSGSSSLTGSAGPVTYVNTKPTAAGNAAGNYDLMLLKYTPAGTVTWALFHGGSQTEFVYSAASDLKENILLTGWTNSANFPVANAAQPALAAGYDAFVLKFDKDGVLRWGTFLGGAGTENSGFGGVGFGGVAADYDGNVFVTGTVQNGTFPTTPGAAWPAKPTSSGIDAWLAKYDPEGLKLWATYFGGTGSDYGVGLACNAQGSVALCGYTNSADLSVNSPAQDPPFQEVMAGANDAFIAKFDRDGRPTWITYFGAAGDDQGLGIAYSRGGALLLVGESTSGGAPFAKRGHRQIERNRPVAQDTNHGTQDLFASLFCDPETPLLDSSGRHAFGYNDTLRLWLRGEHRSVKWYMAGAPFLQVGTRDTLVIWNTGAFFAVVENEAGCTAVTDTISAVRCDRPRPGVDSSGGHTLDAGESLALWLRTRGYRSVQWYRAGPPDVLVGERDTLLIEEPGRYFAVAEDRDGCKVTTDMISIRRCNPATPRVDSSGVHTFDAGDSLALWLRSGAYRNVQWYRAGPPDVLVGQGDTLVIKVSGRFFARAEDGDGCRVTTDTIRTQVKSIGGVAGEPSGALVGLRIFPDPASAVLTAEYSVPAAGRVRLHITNSAGAEVLRREEQVRERGIHQLRIELDALPTGVYFVTVVADGGRAVRAFRVQR